MLCHACSSNCALKVLLVEGPSAREYSRGPIGRLPRAPQESQIGRRAIGSSLSCTTRQPGRRSLDARRSRGCASSSLWSCPVETRTILIPTTRGAGVAPRDFHGLPQICSWPRSGVRQTRMRMRVGRRLGWLVAPDARRIASSGRSRRRSSSRPRRDRARQTRWRASHVRRRSE